MRPLQIKEPRGPLPLSVLNHMMNRHLELALQVLCHRPCHPQQPAGVWAPRVLCGRLGAVVGAELQPCDDDGSREESTLFNQLPKDLQGVLP